MKKHKEKLKKRQMRTVINALHARIRQLVNENLALSMNPDHLLNRAMEKEDAVEMALAGRKYGDDAFRDLVCVQ